MSTTKKAVLSGIILLIAVLSQIHAADAKISGTRFATPEEAVAALQRASAAADTNALQSVLGPGSEELENSDRVQALTELKTFSNALGETNRLVRVSDTRFELEIGADSWPFPVPLVKKDGAWIFDTEAGKDELLSRRIGGNELAVLPTLRAYVQAQRQYASLDHDGDDVLEFAQRLASSPGKEDGLYWTPLYEGDESPLGPLVAYAQAEGYSAGTSNEKEVERGPFHGYVFKILTQQGKHAPGGKYDYITNGNMIGGFAMVAWPVEYGSSGIMTFIVSHHGRVYQKDLGPKTAKTAVKMKSYDPDPTWTLSPD